MLQPVCGFGFGVKNSICGVIRLCWRPYLDEEEDTVLQVLAITAPLFLIMAIGYLCVRLELLPVQGLSILGQYVVSIGLPALLLGNLAQSDLAAAVDPFFLLAYGLGSLLAYILGLVVFRLFKGDVLSKSGLQALGVSFSNNAFIGFPLLLQVFAEPPTAAFGMAVLVENFLILPLALVLMSLGHAREEGQNSSVTDIARSVVRRVVLHPVVISIVAGVLISALKLPLPAFVYQSLDILGRTSAGVALVVIGGSLAGQHLGLGFIQGWKVILGKLVGHPAMVFLMLMVFPVEDPALYTAAILMAAVPMLSIFPIFAESVGLRVFAANTLVATTVTSFFTISVLLWLLGL